MIKLTLVAIICSLDLQSFAQTILFDTSRAFDNNKSRIYDFTDFRKYTETNSWRVLLDTSYHGQSTDSVKPLGRLIFYSLFIPRDTSMQMGYEQLRKPSMLFEIFNIEDSLYCFEIAKNTFYLSSCLPPNVGGDIVLLKPFILVNRSVCLSCGRFEKILDYCRPPINIILNRLKQIKHLDFNKLTSSIPISEKSIF